MNFTNVKSITIPNGKVAKISVGDKVRWQASALPSAYQQVEYISKARSTSAYIDLGFSFDKGATVYIKYNKHEPSYYVFGAAENSGKLRCMISLNDTIKAYGSTGSGYTQVPIPESGNGEYKLIFIIKKGRIRIEDSVSGNVDEGGTNQAEYTMSNHLYLMAQNYNGTVRSDCSVWLRSFSYYDNDDNLICDLIPCYRKSDGEIGMYDIVRKIFLTSAGTGKFTKGPDV